MVLHNHQSLFIKRLLLLWIRSPCLSLYQILSVFTVVDHYFSLKAMEQGLQFCMAESFSREDLYVCLHTKLYQYLQLQISQRHPLFDQSLSVIAAYWKACSVSQPSNMLSLNPSLPVVVAIQAKASFVCQPNYLCLLWRMEECFFEMGLCACLRTKMYQCLLFQHTQCLTSRNQRVSNSLPDQYLQLIFACQTLLV